MDNILLSFVIINYNSGKILSDCIKSIVSKKIDFEYEIVIVDNNSKDDSMSFDCDKCVKVYLKENIGFVKGNNLGVKNAKGKYIYILNPDTVLLDNKIINLINVLESNSKCGIVAPKVFNSDMTLQLTIRREPTLRRLFFYLFGISRIFSTSNYFVDYKMEKANFDSILYPDWVSGCSFIISKELFIKVGGFDEDLFMYWEDVTICREIRKMGYHIEYHPTHKLIHYGGVSSTKVKLFSSFMDIKSRFTYFKKYYSRFYYIGIKQMTFINVILRGIIEFARLKKKNGITYFKLFFKIIKI